MNISSINIELTDRCQASCPMCMRNFSGGAEREHIKNIEISIKQFKEWMPKEFLMGLKHIAFCGSNGDPIIATDVVDIIEYVHSNSTCDIVIHTNGSLRTTSWWLSLANKVSNRVKVIFAIDGFKGEHEIYRRGTSWDKIIENAKAFIAAGGIAWADCIVFKHNEDNIKELEKFLYSIGFENVNLKKTDRFFGSQKVVLDKQGYTEYIIYPPINSNWSTEVISDDTPFLNKDYVNAYVNNSVIDPECMTRADLALRADGLVFPCTKTSSYKESLPSTENKNYRIIAEMIDQSVTELIDSIGYIDLRKGNIVEGLKEIQWGEKMQKHLTTCKKGVCTLHCGKEYVQV